MFKLFTKKRISEEKTANVFINTIFNMVDNGFPLVTEVINYDPEFARSPNISENNSDRFLMIVIAGNLKMLPNHFDAYQDMKIIDQVYRKLAQAFEMDLESLKRVIGQYQHYMSKVNHPSKNVLRSMSNAFFFKYKLNCYQQAYFKAMNTPNPIFLKRLNEVMENFVFNWEEFKEKYRVG